MGLIFSFFARLKYWFAAQNRHDIHSPFVFEFVEQIINKKKAANLNIGYTKLQQSIISRIIDYYKPEHLIVDNVVIVGYTCESKHLSKFHRIFVYSNTANLQGEWTKNDMIIVCHNNKNKVSQWQWQGLYKQMRVTLSLDLFELGILFLKNDFRVKQHFVLRT